jgi:hypothetical protein
MTPAQIVSGKFWSVFYPLALELTYFLPVSLILGNILKLNLISFVLAYMLVLINMALITIISLHSSSKSYNSRYAKQSAIASVTCFLAVELIFVLALGVQLLNYIVSSLLGTDVYIKDLISNAESFPQNPGMFFIFPFPGPVLWIFFYMQQYLTKFEYSPLLVIQTIFTYCIYFAIIRYYFHLTEISVRNYSPEFRRPPEL